MALVSNTQFRRCGLVVIINAVVITALAIATVAPRSAAAQSAAPSAEIPSASATAASVLGHVVPLHLNVGLRAHGFVADNGVFTTIDAPRAGLYTLVFGTGDDGRTVGGYVDRKRRVHGFLLDHGKFTTIDFPGAKATFAARINSKGQIVGAYSHEANVAALELSHGFLLDHGVFTKIDVPGAVRTQPFGINNHGQIVGEYVDAARKSHGFLLDHSVYTTIDAPDSASTWATDIGDSGQIVGVGFGGVTRGFLRDAEGAFTTIKAPPDAIGPPDPGRPESPQTYAFGINNHGQIAGVFTDSKGMIHGFSLVS
jgi:uncharacterized membrane protein